MTKSSNPQKNDSKADLSQFLVEKDGVRQLVVSKENLPPFIVEADKAIITGDIDRAIKLLNEESVESVRQLLAKDPSRVDVMLTLAIMFSKTEQLKKAEEWYKKLLEHQPYALIFNELACIYQKVGHVSEAMEYRQKAFKADPDNVGIWSNLAVDMMLAGKMEEGLDLMRKVVEKQPSNAAYHTSMLWYTHYLPKVDRQSFFEEHKKWGRIHAPASMARSSHANDPDPERRLRIGYISADFRMHSIAYNFEAFLNGHNRQVVEVYGYGNVARPDKITKRIKNKFDHYRSVYGLSDKAAADLIVRDRIDILVELGGYSADHRMLVLAYKPAPIQVDYGGMDTSGMQQIDYRLTDEILDPPGSEKFYTEELIYLPDGVFCYTPPDFAPPVATLPALRNGYVTFGSFNANLKVNPHILSLWAQILKANDTSRLIMKFGGGDDQKIKERFYRSFEQFGINRDRINIFGWKKPIEHLQLYNEVDIALDTYPYNGCLTTLEGLWMGIPTITLAGKGFYLCRVGLTILSRIGLEYFAASGPDEYVAKGVALAQKPDALAKIRASMRGRMAASVLCDAKGFAGNIEAAYRKMWHRWCRSQGVEVRSEKLNCDTEFVVADSLAHSSVLTETVAELPEDKRG